MSSGYAYKSWNYYSQGVCSLVLSPGLEGRGPRVVFVTLWDLHTYDAVWLAELDNKSHYIHCLYVRNNEQCYQSITGWIEPPHKAAGPQPGLESRLPQHNPNGTHCIRWATERPQDRLSNSSVSNSSASDWDVEQFNFYFTWTPEHNRHLSQTGVYV